MKLFAPLLRYKKMPAKTLRVQARIEPELKVAAERVFESLGLTPTEAIRVFYRQVELHQGLPFDVRIPNKTTQAAIDEAETIENLESFEDTSAPFNSL